MSIGSVSSIVAPQRERKLPPGMGWPQPPEIDWDKTDGGINGNDPKLKQHNRKKTKEAMTISRNAQIDLMVKLGVISPEKAEKMKAQEVKTPEEIMEDRVPISYLA